MNKIITIWDENSRFSFSIDLIRILRTVTIQKKKDGEYISFPAIQIFIKQEIKEVKNILVYFDEEENRNLNHDRILEFLIQQDLSSLIIRGYID